MNLLFLFGFTSLIAVGLSFFYFEKGSINNLKEIGNFYKIGFSTFIINSAAGMILMADKFFANNIFNIELANAYTFSWAIVAPIFYLGNIAEKNIYAASSKRSLKNSVINSLLLIILGLFVYFITVYLLINQFSYLLPQSINLQLFSEIVLVMLSGYSIFILFHFPVNGVLFKYNLHDSQKFTSYAYLIIIGVFLILYSLNIIVISSENYLNLFSLVLIALISLSITKFLLVTFLHKKEVFAFFTKG